MARSSPAASPTSAAPPKSPRETAAIMARLFQQHPNAFTELDFRTPFELLVATILSAQSTDKRVNEVTPALFRKYPHAAALAQASPAELEREIKTTGFFRQKTKAIMGMAQALVAEHRGEVPVTMEVLVTLPGVGRKTANVVLGHALGVPGLPVDRHVLRVANRIGIAHAATPEEVEAQLCAAMPREQWTLTSDTLILHGRRICRPRPLCEQCAVVDVCDFARNWNKTAAIVSPDKTAAKTPRKPAAGGARTRGTRAGSGRGRGSGAASRKAGGADAALDAKSRGARTATREATAARAVKATRGAGAATPARAAKATNAANAAKASRSGRRSR